MLYNTNSEWHWYEQCYKILHLVKDQHSLPRWIEHQSFTLCEILYHCTIFSSAIRYLYVYFMSPTWHQSSTSCEAGFTGSQAKYLPRPMAGACSYTQLQTCIRWNVHLGTWNIMQMLREKYNNHHDLSWIWYRSKLLAMIIWSKP